VQPVVGVLDAACVAQLGQGDEGYFGRGVFVKFVVTSLVLLLDGLVFVLVVVSIVIRLGFNFGLFGQPAPAAALLQGSIIFVRISI
jgi:hypothetical protein